MYFRIKKDKTKTKQCSTLGNIKLKFELWKKKDTTKTILVYKLETLNLNLKKMKDDESIVTLKM